GVYCHGARAAPGVSLYGSRLRVRQSCMTPSDWPKFRAGRGGHQVGRTFASSPNIRTEQACQIEWEVELRRRDGPPRGSRFAKAWWPRATRTSQGSPERREF